MAFGSFNSNNNAQPMAEINTTPLVDVMLVLLVIFIITAPLLTNSIPLQLPQATAKSSQNTPHTIRLSINLNEKKKPQFFMNNQPITLLELEKKLTQEKIQFPESVVELYSDKTVAYESVAQLMATVQRSGIDKMGFATTPQ